MREVEVRVVGERSPGRSERFEQVALDRRASWWGYYEITPDHNAIIGTDPSEPRWINACGFSGHGVQQSAGAGRAVAELIAHGRSVGKLNTYGRGNTVQVNDTVLSRLN